MPIMNRRQFLAALSAGATGGALSGCSSPLGSGASTPGVPTARDGTAAASGSASSESVNTGTQQTTARTATSEPAPSYYGVEFDRAIDVVADLGADPTGSDPIDDIIDEHYRDGTVLEFPPGSYLVERSHHFNSGENVDRWGMVGTGASRRDVQFVFPKGNETANPTDRHYVLNVQSGTDHVLADMTMQQTPDTVTGVGMILALSDGLHVENFEFAGFNPVGQYAPGSCIIAGLRDVSGVGTIKHFVATGGGVMDTYPHRRNAILCGAFHRGELRLLDHDIRNMGSNAHYTSNHRGCVRTEGCYFENNDNANIRISGGQSGGHPTKDSWAKDCTVVVDIDAAKDPPDGESYEFIRGIKCDYGEDALVEDTDVIYKSAPAAPFCVGVLHNHGKATFRNVRVRSDVDGIGPLFEGQPNGAPVVLENVRLTGTAGEFSRGRAALSLRQRDESIVRDSCVKLTGGNQNGIWFQGSEGCQIQNVSIDVPGEQILTDGAEPTLDAISDDGPCVGPVDLSDRYRRMRARVDS